MQSLDGLTSRQRQLAIAGIVVGGVVLVGVVLSVFQPKLIGNLLAFGMFGLLILVAIGAWAAPIWIAFSRDHASKLAITLVNVFFGWSLIGWGIALIWSLSNPGSAQATQTVVINQGNTTLPGQAPSYEPYVGEQAGYSVQQPIAQAAAQPQLTHWMVGDVVNGHRWNGVEWRPLPPGHPNA